MNVQYTVSRLKRYIKVDHIKKRYSVSTCLFRITEPLEVLVMCGESLLKPCGSKHDYEEKLVNLLKTSY